jgi:ABC-type phosphate transport system substrate-binding protein
MRSGAAGRIKISKGSIGYVGYEFAERLGLPGVAGKQGRTIIHPW